MAAEAFSYAVSVVQEDCPLVRYVSLQEPPTPQLFKCYVTPAEKQYYIKVSSSIPCAFYVYVDGKSLRQRGFTCGPEKDTIVNYFDCPPSRRRESVIVEAKLAFVCCSSAQSPRFEQATSADATAVTSTTGRIVKYATKLGAEIHVDSAQRPAKVHTTRWVLGSRLSVTTICLVTDKQLQVMGCEPDSPPNDDGIVFFNPAPVAPPPTSRQPRPAGPPAAPAAEGIPVLRRRRRKQLTATRPALRVSIHYFTSPGSIRACSARRSGHRKSHPVIPPSVWALAQPPVVTVTQDEPAAPNKRPRTDSMAELIEELGGHSSAGGAAALPVDQAQRRVRALRVALGAEAMGLRGAAATERLIDLTPDQLRLAEPALSQAEATALLQDVVASTA
ncbi:hypothetical protein PAPYR_6040 [Paratrimastix pyriformis]|uniref:Uncharacterized protein n=1 Tax=Paratrimastix pyriformis TaxID=342808 RepID=A0ABQ8UIH1_9EUKA|nr:hypothetical protein PAPYR_6040 [Paratrimastix pyriformis]